MRPENAVLSSSYLEVLQIVAKSAASFFLKPMNARGREYAAQCKQSPHVAKLHHFGAEHLEN